MTPPESNSSSVPDDSQLPIGTWVARNGTYLLVMVAALVGIWTYMGTEGVWNIAKAALGLGFVVFIHELGHFAVAKWCDVHVETFSIGFGPALPGCSFLKGETLYKLALLPLGGYVKMVGEGSENEEDENDPRSFKNKTVGQRMAIISAGVIMNVLLGAVCFVVAYRNGVKETPGTFGGVDAGSPAWTKGIRSGMTIKELDEIQNPSFEDMKFEVMLTRKGQQLPFTVSLPGQADQTILIETRREEYDSAPVIGVLPQMREPRLPPSDLVKKHKLTLAVGAAAAARALDQERRPLPDVGFEAGDVIIGTTDASNANSPYDPYRVTPLPEKAIQNRTETHYDYFEFAKRLQILAGKPMVFQVLREGASSGAQPVSILVPGAFHRTLGARMVIGKIAAIRDNSPASEAGVRVDDWIRSVDLVDSKGETAHFVLSGERATTEPVVYPERLPWELRRWTEGRTGVHAKLMIARTALEGQEEKSVEHEITLNWDDSRRFDVEFAFSMRSPLSVAELGLAYSVEPTIDAVEPDSPADKAGLKKGDVLVEGRFQETDRIVGTTEWSKRWLEFTVEEKESQGKKLLPGWPHFFEIIQDPHHTEQVQFRVRRGTEVLPQEFTLSLNEDMTWPLEERGLRMEVPWRVRRAESLAQALELGVQRTTHSILKIYESLHSMVTNRVSVTKNLSGPIGIATMAYDIAGEDMNTFMLFLGMISVNLAVVNFLPIPVLDGGHMVFLIYERVRGRPPSEPIRAAATYAGVFFILSLMAFVIFLDIKRRWMGS